MSEHALLAQVRAANPVPSADVLPEGTIDVRTLRNYVANTPTIETDDLDETVALQGMPDGVDARRGGWLAAAVFVAVLALGIGFWFARSGSESDVVEPPQVTTTLPTATTTPPTTEAIGEGAVVDAQAMTVIEGFATSLDERDAGSASSFVSAEAGTLLIERIATADGFDDGYDLGDCLAFDDGIRCEVLISDFFTKQLDIEPWQQTWEIQIDQGAIASLEISGERAEVTQALADFEDFVTTRDPEAPPLTGDTGDWVRSQATIETVSPYLVEFAALRSGIPPDTWATIAAYFTTLSAGDLEAFETLLAPDAAFEERSGPNGDLTVRYTRAQDEFLGHFWFEYIGLKTDTAPIKCTGDAVAVSCRARNTGVLQLDTGGFEDGLLLFDLEDALITSVRDRFNMADLGNLYNTWIFDNGPDLTGQWSGTSTDIPETPEVARLLLQWYPRYLADTGTEVPPEYLDGSLLED